jgi:hypothetical protein
MRSRTQVWLVALTCFGPITYAGTDDPLSRLQHVRSLRCTYENETTVGLSPGRKVTEDHDVFTVVYDNIDLKRGTARAIYVKGISPGAGDVSVRWIGNALWFTEVPQSSASVSNAAMTTVFARYAQGTENFLALDTRHSGFVIVTGSMASGTCTELR